MTTASSVSPEFEPAIQHLREVLRGVRTGRASVGLVESVMVEQYGTSMRLRDMASLSTPDARTIQIEPWDKGAVAAVEKSLLMSSLGMTPTVAGTVIRLSIPLLTEERRKELVKLVKKQVEDARIAVRNLREKRLKEFKRKHEDDEWSDDELARQKAELQTAVDAVLEAIAEAGKEKEAEVLGE
jgi:ribosome recycling factor